jgi:outer membrane lipoprotein-sorting protein
MNTFPHLFLMGFVALMLAGAPSPASWEGEPSAESAPAPEASAESGGDAPNPPEVSDSNGDVAPEVESPAEPPPARPDLPAIPEEKELLTVREDDPAPAPAGVVPAETLALLNEIEKRHASVVTVKGSFDQLKVSEIFLEEIRSKGTFWYRKPDQFRCDYEPPDEMTNLILRDAIYVYVPAIEQCEVYRFASDRERDQQLHSMVLGFGFKTKELLEEYTVRSSANAEDLREELVKAGRDPGQAAILHLTPLPAFEDSSPFTELKLWIDKARLLPEKVWFEDYNGDRTTIEIRSIDLNTAVDPSLFTPSFPRGTEFIDKSGI